MFLIHKSLIGIFSGNLSVDLSEGSKWNISRSGFCGMRSKKVNNTELSFFLQSILIQNIFSAYQFLFEKKKEKGLLYFNLGFVTEILFEAAECSIATNSTFLCFCSLMASLISMGMMQ